MSRYPAIVSPSQQDIRSMYRWDEETNSFFNLRTQRHKHPSPDKAGYNRTTYLSLRMQQSRMVWIYHNGTIPDGMEIDHIDGDRGNDRIANLRICTHAENCRNRSSPSKSKSGFKGVQALRNGRFHAHISSGGIIYSIGTYKTAELAAQWYDAAAKTLHDIYARTNFMLGRVADTDLVWSMPVKRKQSSIYRGVRRYSAFKWVATISEGRKHIWLGAHAVEQDAARAYDIAAIERGRKTNVDLGLLPEIPY